MNYKGYFDGQCVECTACTTVCMHHLVHGQNRKKWSDKYDLVRPMCMKCHGFLHGKDGHEIDLKYKVIAQIQFEKEHPELSFLEVFGRLYL